MGVGVMELLVLGVAGAIAALTVAYAVIRLAVRDGMVDAQRRIETQRVRAQLGVGPERGPNSRR